VSKGPGVYLRGGAGCKVLGSEPPTSREGAVAVAGAGGERGGGRQSRKAKSLTGGAKGQQAVSFQQPESLL